MRTLSWTLILLALISFMWVLLIDLAKATQSVSDPRIAQLRAQGIVGSKTNLAALPKKNCKTRDHGLWGVGKDRKRIKTTWCNGKYVMTWVGKWAKL